MVNLASFGYQSPSTQQEARSFEAVGSSRSEELEAFSAVGSSQSLSSSFNAVSDRNSDRNMFLEENGISDISQFSAIARGLQTGFGVRSADVDSVSEGAASEATAFATTTTSNRETFGRHDFNATEYGRAKDAEAAAAGGEDGFTQDADKELAVDEKQPNMAMGVDLDAYDKLVEANIPLEDLAYARSMGKDDKEMLFNHESGLAVDGGKMVESGLPLQVQRQVDALQANMSQKDVNYVDTDDKERAAKVDNGIEASSLGAMASVRAAGMMVG